MCVRRVESMTHYRVILCLKMNPFTVNSSKNIYPFTVLPFCQPLHFFTIIKFDLYLLNVIDPFLLRNSEKMEPFSCDRTVPCLSLKITPFYRGFTHAHSFRTVLTSGPPPRPGRELQLVVTEIMALSLVVTHKRTNKKNIDSFQKE